MMIRKSTSFLPGRAVKIMKIIKNVKIYDVVLLHDELFLSACLCIRVDRRKYPSQHTQKLHRSPVVMNLKSLVLVYHNLAETRPVKILLSGVLIHRHPSESGQ